VIRVGVLGRHSLERAGVRQVIEEDSKIRVVGDDQIENARHVVRTARPDLLVMSHVSEDEALRTLKSLEALKAAPARIVLINRLSKSGTRRLLRGGAHGILLSADSVNHLAWAARAAVAGSIALAPEAARIVVDRYLQPSHAGEEAAVARARMTLLSPREHEILTLLGEGLSNPAVAEKLSISGHTVKDHIRAIYSKLGVDNRVQAAHMAWRAQYQDQDRS